MLVTWPTEIPAQWTWLEANWRPYSEPTTREPNQERRPAPTSPQRRSAPQKRASRRRCISRLRYGGTDTCKRWNQAGNNRRRNRKKSNDSNRTRRLASDINFKEIEEALYESIENLSRINKGDALKTKKETRKERRVKQKLEQIWLQREARKLWTSDMKLSECEKSLYRFRPTYNIELW